MKKFIGTMAAFAVALSASAALAGVYVSGPLPSEFAGGAIPANPDTLKSIGKSSKEGSKLVGGISKCYSKGAKNVSKGNASGVDACLNDASKGVITKYLSKVAGITGLPPCSGAGPAAVAQILPIVKGFNGLIYCQSPSGAFLDNSSF